MLNLYVFLSLDETICRRTAGKATMNAQNIIRSSRFYPMLRLFSEEDLAMLPDGKSRRALKTQRLDIFAGYLRSLRKNYEKTLGGMRVLIVQLEGQEELALTLMKNHGLFLSRYYQISFFLVLRWLGIKKAVDPSSLILAYERLKEQLNKLQ